MSKCVRCGRDNRNVNDVCSICEEEIYQADMERQWYEKQMEEKMMEEEMLKENGEPLWEDGRWCGTEEED